MLIKDFLVIQSVHKESKKNLSVFSPENMDFRLACAVLNESDFFVGTHGGFGHAAAALNKKAVLYCGGWISPETMAYDFHENIYYKDKLSPCGEYGTICDHCSEARKAISVTEASIFLEKVRSDFFVTAHANQFTSGGLKVGVDNGAVSVDHLEVITDHEIDYLSISNTSGVVLPGCSIGLGIPFAPARKLLDNNCKVSIASDWNPGSAPMGDLLMQASLLGSIEKLSNAEVLAGITCRSANALSLEDRGSLENGKIADMIGFGTNDFRDVLYNQGKLKPSLICKRGKFYN